MTKTGLHFSKLPLFSVILNIGLRGYIMVQVTLSMCLYSRTKTDNGGGNEHVLTVSKIGHSVSPLVGQSNTVLSLRLENVQRFSTFIKTF